MIKGINKQILEVTNTDSPYFEKIIFFVRPDSQNVSEQKLKSEAEKISLDIKKPPKSKKTLKQKMAGAGFVFLGLAAGTALTFIIGTLL